MGVLTLFPIILIALKLKERETLLENMLIGIFLVLLILMAIVGTFFVRIN